MTSTSGGISNRRFQQPQRQPLRVVAGQARVECGDPGSADDELRQHAETHHHRLDSPIDAGVSDVLLLGRPHLLPPEPGHDVAGGQVLLEGQFIADDRVLRPHHARVVVAKQLFGRV